MMRRSCSIVVQLLWLIVQRPALGGKTRITFINGIAYSQDDCDYGQGFISTKFGGKPVISCYNPTSMAHESDVLGYMSDLTQATTQKYWGRITEEVTSLVQHLKQALVDVGRHGTVIHIAHSQGALITSLAAKHLAPTELSQIQVISLGGAAALQKTPRTPFSRCINYYAINDPLLFVVPEAAQALRSGLMLEDSEFCFLAPQCGDPVQDHCLWGPTYGQALSWEGARFQRHHVSVIERATQRIVAVLRRDLIRQILIVLVSILGRLRAVFKELILRPILSCCVLTYQVTRALLSRAIIEGAIKNWILRPLVSWCVLCYHWTTTMAWRTATIVRKDEEVAEGAASTTSSSFRSWWWPEKANLTTTHSGWSWQRNNKEEAAAPLP